jgi:hypothetical protein
VCVHTQETKGTNEHDKKEPKKGTAISLKTSINTWRWPNWAETCCVVLKFKVCDFKILKFKQRQSVENTKSVKKTSISRTKDGKEKWKWNIFTKLKQLGTTLTKMHWLLGRKLKLSTNNKIFIYKWYSNTSGPMAYNSGAQHLYLTLKFSNTSSQNTLRIITDIPWYVPNETIRKDLQTPMVKEEISHHSTQYSKRLIPHFNKLTLNLQEPPRKRQLQWHLPIDLPITFNM